MIIFDIARIIFIVIAIVSLFTIIPIITALSCGEYWVLPNFLIPMLFAVLIGFIFYVFGKKRALSLSTRSVFFVVSFSWIGICFYGSLPLFFSGSTKSYLDAFFESVSGFTTTGGTIFSDVESLPRSINLWRCEMHWLGGMGVIALTTALLPLLGIGGFQLIKAESTGPEKGKITPKIANTAKNLWLIYVIFTFMNFVLLLVCGMDVIDSLSHAFSTLGTGGFSTKNSSIAYYNSSAVDTVCTIFMLLAGVNFSLYFYLISRKYEEIKKNSELKLYLGIVTVVIAILVLCLFGFYGSFGKSLRYVAFQVASIISTTGFMTSDYTLWPSYAQFFIFILFFIGGCSGSTAGGFKVVRWLVLGKQAKNEMLRMLHPHGVFNISLNGKAGRKDLVFNVSAFMFVYIILALITTFIGTLSGIDIYTSFTAAFSMIGNIGPAFGELGPTANYGFLSDGVKIWYSFAMIAGRLELYNMIIFFLFDYWRK